MKEEFENDACNYLLHEMDGAQRASFETQLDRDSTARARLKAQAEALAAFACEIARPESMSAVDHRVTLDALVAASRSPQAVTGASRHSPAAIKWLQLVWPVAAAILLLLNLLDFERPLSPLHKRAPTDPVARESNARPQSGSSAEKANSAAGGADEKGSTVAVPGGPQSPAAASSTSPADELAQLRASVANLEREREQLRAQYLALAQSVAAAAASDRHLNRLTTMELTDAASFARGERKGLVHVGRSILTEPGVVVAPDAANPLPPGSTTSLNRPSYAWSVFDEQERRGYLNLYDLPNPGPEQSLQIWVRPSDAVGFQRVGEVPAQFYGGNGNVNYTLPGSNSTPAEILITIEPRAGVAVTPSGSTVLRGP